MLVVGATRDEVRHVTQMDRVRSLRYRPGPDIRGGAFPPGLNANTKSSQCPPPRGRNRAIRRRHSDDRDWNAARILHRGLRYGRAAVQENIAGLALRRKKV